MDPGCLRSLVSQVAQAGPSQPSTAMGELFAWLESDLHRIEGLWQSAATRVGISHGQRPGLQDSLGTLFELAGTKGMFADFEVHTGDLVRYVDRHLYTLMCAAHRILFEEAGPASPGPDPLASTTDEGSSCGDLSGEGGEEDHTLEDRREAFLAVALGLFSAVTDPSHEFQAGFVLLLGHMEASKTSRELMESFPKAVWGAQADGILKRARQVHEGARIRLRRNRDHESGITRQHGYIRELAKKIKAARTDTQKKELEAVMEKRMGILKRHQERRILEKKLRLGSWLLPLSQKEVAAVLDPEERIDAESWGRTANRFKKRLEEALLGAGFSVREGS